VRADTDPQQADYIALFLGDDEDQSAVAGRLTFVAVPAESLQDVASGSNGDSNVCVLLQTGGGSSQEANSNPSGHTQIVWRWQTSPSKPSSPEEACPEFAQSTSTINMRDLE